MADFPYRPWKADEDDRDEEMFRVVRGADGRPLLFVSKWLSANEQEDLIRLIEAAPDLITYMREVFYHATDRYGHSRWTGKDWKAWRLKAGPVIAELWPAEWNKSDESK